jgi:hypothetical protein
LERERLGGVRQSSPARTTSMRLTRRNLAKLHQHSAQPQNKCGSRPKYPGIQQSEMCRHEPRDVHRKETTTSPILTFGGAGWLLRAGGRPRSRGGS